MANHVAKVASKSTPNRVRRHPGLRAELAACREEIERLRARLKDGEQLKTAFIEVVGHELRSPLTILRGMSRLAAEAAGSTEPLRNWLERTRNAAERLHQLVDQIVGMLRGGRTFLPLSSRPFDVARLLRDAENEVLPFVHLRYQSLLLEPPETLGRFSGDEGLLRDSLVQLLLNAVKFTPDGGQLSLGACRLDDGDLEIQVADAGIGIDPRCLPYLFEPFFTGFDVSEHSSGTFEFGRKGVGLGLWAVKACIERHGGRIRVRSELGRGSTFTIRLPNGPENG